jgi:plastocyanin
MKTMLRYATWTALAWTAALLAAGPEAAQDKGRGAPATAADIARLEGEIREQRTMILRMLKNEQERSDLMLKLLEGRCGPSAAARESRGDSGAQTAATDPAMVTPEPAAPASSSTVTIKGKVTGQGKLDGVYVYLDGMRSSGKGKTLEIMQKGKEFIPSLAIAVAGTKATFPNRDVMFHNVFSPSPKPFDIGTKGAGETGPAVELDTPGVVEVYCNIHGKMNAKILVVPNRVYARANADGSFKLEKVPQGKRKLVAWGPGFKAQRRDVEVTADGADVTFNLEVEPYKPHPNKAGMPYGSYKE